jgi:uncharacterized protein YigA (DUF484 family)
MHSQLFHIDPDIDHKEERVHHLLVDDSLFDAVNQRLDAAHAHLDAAAADETVGVIRRRLDVAMVRIRHVKTGIETYYESGPYNRDLHQKLHEVTLNIADHAESLARRFEEPGGRGQILSFVEASIADLERVIDECNQMLKKTL